MLSIKKSSNFLYPNGKDFIFSIFDDTDVATFSYIKPIYDFLSSLNIKTTKSVWPITYSGQCDDKGSHTLEDEEYATYIKELKKRGFEIGYHGARMISSKRNDTLKSFILFKKISKHYPTIFASHSTNKENLYWGEDRFTFKIFKLIYRVMTQESSNYYQGHIEGSPYFWGDYALSHINFSRSFTYNTINLLNISKNITYSCINHPYIKSWFISSDANNVNEFNRLIRPENQEKLLKERGICIISTHFGKGFIKNGELNKKTKYYLSLLRKKNGWFVPVSEALNFLMTQRDQIEISKFDLFKLELFWFFHAIIRKFNSLDYEKTELPYLEPKST